MRTRTKGQGNKRMKRFRETGSMLKDPSKGSSLRRDLGKGAADIKTAFKKIKDAGKSLTRGTKDLTATRVMQGPAAGSSLIVASKKLASGTKDAKKARIDNMTGYEKAVYMQNEGKVDIKKQKLRDKIKKVEEDIANTGRGFSTAPLKTKLKELKNKLANL